MKPEINVMSGCGSFEIVYVVLRMFNSMQIRDYFIINFFYFNLSHELGHIATARGLCLEEKYRNLDELISDRVNENVMNRLISRGFFQHRGFINENLGLHKVNFFLLEPFWNEFSDYFKKASIENDLSLLSSFMGEDLLERYVDVINDFYEYQRSNCLNAWDIFKDDYEYVEDVKKKIEDILFEVKKKNGIFSRVCK